MSLCLTNLSHIAQAQGRTERAACLLAADDVMRALLGEARFQASWNQGLAFTWEEALADALSDEEAAAR